MAKRGANLRGPAGSRGRGLGGQAKGKGFDKERARQRLRELVHAKMDAMVEAQIANAQGVKVMVSRSKTGQFKPVTDIQAALIEDPEAKIIEVWEEKPNVQAFTDLMNRTIDKPIEQVAGELKHDLTIRWQASDD